MYIYIYYVRVLSHYIHHYHVVIYVTIVTSKARAKHRHIGHIGTSATTEVKRQDHTGSLCLCVEIKRYQDLSRNDNITKKTYPVS